METDRLKNVQATLRRELESLSRTREELRVQANLAQADMRAEWERLEKRFQHAQEECARLADHTKAAAQDIEQRTRTLIQELKASYERIRGAS